MIQKVKDTLFNAGVEMDIEVVEVKFDAKASTLSVFIDSIDGIDLDICEKYHLKIDALLDEIDFTSGKPYTLNVSSLGLDRPFKSTRDFVRNLNKDVEAKLYAPILKGKKIITGQMVAFDDDTVTILSGDGEIKLERVSIAKITKLIQV